ncbi:MAG TPA: hypothetical protein VM492_01860 [Sumerlaeia bacterium]|nr:hypothetical protein [Sumerlaeia bacterium]
MVYPASVVVGGNCLDRRRRHDGASLAAPQGDRPETQETRRLDFEIQAPESASGRATFQAYALYYVCEGVGGQCLFLRQDAPIEVEASK